MRSTNLHQLFCMLFCTDIDLTHGGPEGCMPYSVKGIFEISGYSTYQNKVQWKTGLKNYFIFMR